MLLDSQNAFLLCLLAFHCLMNSVICFEVYRRNNRFVTVGTSIACFLGNKSTMRLNSCQDVLGRMLTFAGGVYSQMNGITVNNIAQWNGVTWDSVGSGTN